MEDTCEDEAAEAPADDRDWRRHRVPFRNRLERCSGVRRTCHYGF
jgi:hypothetical protein